MVTAAPLFKKLDSTTPRFRTEESRDAMPPTDPISYQPSALASSEFEGRCSALRSLVVRKCRSLTSRPVCSPLQIRSAA